MNWAQHLSGTSVLLSYFSQSGLCCRKYSTSPVGQDFRNFISAYTHSTDLNVVEVHVLGKAAVLVNQKTEPSFLFKESFSAAFCNKSLNITLSRGHCFQILRAKGKKRTT